jgi:hypothetical protein
MAVQATMQTAMAKLVPLAPDSWIPGGVPDPLIWHEHGLIGSPISRLDGSLKVRGAARFAAEVPLENMVYAALVYGTIPSGRIATLDTQAAEAAPGVVLVMTYRIMATRSGYAADSFKLSVETVTMNMLANIFMRAPGVHRVRGRCEVQVLAPTEGSRQPANSTCIRVSTYVDLQLWVKKIAV